MQYDNRSAAVAVSPPGTLSAGSLGPFAAGGSFSDVTRLAAKPLGPMAAAGGGLGALLRRLGSLLRGLGEMLVIAYAFGFATVAVGIPIALLVRLVVWTAGKL
jgi:hypothetical protein